MKAIAPFVFVPFITLVGCSESIKLANYEFEDQPLPQLASEASRAPSHQLLSAFFGLDNAAPPIASLFVCRRAYGQDGMPVVFSHQLNIQSVQAGDFTVIKADGSRGEISCITPAPAYDQGELRTILLIGELGSAEAPPASVEITGNIFSADNRFNYRGMSVSVTALEHGPSLVLAEPVPADEWELGKTATLIPFGGGSGCPESTQQVVRVVWNGGIKKPNGDEVDDLERTSYRVSIRDGEGKLSTVTPFALGDLGDGDNNHKLCLDGDGTPLEVSFPANLVVDPRGDLNPETRIQVSNR